jgi:hypothetical protein
MEARGVPAVVLGTDAFFSLARAAALKYGLPHLAVALVPHPIGGVDPALVRGKAESIVDQVRDARRVTRRRRRRSRRRGRRWR